MNIASPSSQLPFVGRDRELAILRGRLADVISGRGSLALISGEAGIGKTALVRAIAQEAMRTDLYLLEGRCYERSETPPYGPWLESFTRVSGPNLDRFVLQQPDPANTSNQAEFFSMVRAFLNSLAARRPVVLVLEDIHCADNASLDLLRFFGRTLHTNHLFVVATYRPSELLRTDPLSTLVPILAREAQAERLDLRPLDEATAIDLVRARYDLADPEAERLATYLMTRSDGNALYITEMLRTLETEHLLQHDDAGWHVGEIDRAPVPLFLKQIIEARVARFGDEPLALLVVAAVIGHEVLFSIWKAVTQKDEEALVEVAERAELAHILVATEAGEGIRFAHALIREALYEGVPVFRRKRLHRQIGEAIAAFPGPDPDMVAYHFQQAGDERAPEWLIRAGERAQNQYALVTALDRYVTAFTLLDARMEQPGERGWLRLVAATLSQYQELETARAWVEQALVLADDAEDASLTARALALRGLLRSYGGEPRAGIEDLARAIDAIERLPPSSTDAIRRRERQIDRVANRGTRIALLAFSGHLAQAREEGERYLAEHPTQPSGTVELGTFADVHNGLTMLYAMHGEPERATRSSIASVEAYEAIGHPFLSLAKQREALSLIVLPYFTDDLPLRERVAESAERMALRMLELGARTDLDDVRYARLPLLLLEGHWLEARQIAEESDLWDVAEEILFHNFVLGPLARDQGDRARAWQCVQATWPDGPDVEPGNRFVPYVVPLLLLGAALALDDGDLANARAWLDGHQRWMRFMGATLGVSEHHAYEAAWHRASGDMTRARVHAEQALRQATSPRQPLALLAAHRLLAELDTAAGRYRQAHDHLDTSLALAGACRAPYERALSLFARAELEVAEGRPADATQTLEEVRQTSVPLGARPLIDRVEALAARLGARKASTAHPAGLSARELEVLRLVVDGLTNAQVAERLYVSPRTVNAHLTSIYAKLGVPSRAAAIRFAFEHDLL